jgi:hypothetical protein
MSWDIRSNREVFPWVSQPFLSGCSLTHAVHHQSHDWNNFNFVPVMERLIGCTRESAWKGKEGAHDFTK